MLRLILAAGATGVMVLWSWPAEAERRSESYQFCQGAPDLCVFVCTPECPGMSTDYICESRRGRLVVDEGGTRSYYEESFSLCWHRSRPADDPPPDPEHERVPGWPGSEEGARCMGCETQGKRCQAFAERGEEICSEHYTGRYERYCRRDIEHHRRPADRYGRPFKSKDHHCERILHTVEVIEENDPDMDPRQRKELLKEKGRCRKTVTRECVDHFRESQPGESVSTNAGMRVNIVDVFGVDGGKTETVQWGGGRGFREACRIASDLVGDACVAKRQECEKKASPRKPCKRVR